jgi:PAS domain S-box-containing protein
MGPEGRAEPIRLSPSQEGGEETGWERRALEHQALFLAIAEQSPIMIWRSGQDAQCDYFNSRWLEFRGRKLNEEQGDGWAEGVHPEDFQHCLDTYLASFARREPFEMEYRLKRWDGEYRWILDRGGPYFDEAGEFLGYLGSCVDIHERKQLEADLRRANQAKDEFLAVLSHELRTPLQPILTATQALLLQHRGEPQWERALELIERNARRQARLVADLLDFSRSAQGGLALQRAPLDLNEVVGACAEGLRAQAVEKQHALEVRAPGAPLVVQGDRARLAQVVDNLLTNAIKYTEPGGRIELSTARDGEGAVLRVRATGVGLDPEQLPRVFERFTQVEPSLRRSQGGLGLGLAIVRSLVEEHGGTVTAESEGLGRGSLFTVRLPLAERPGGGAD